MFTGIVAALGEVVRIARQDKNLLLSIQPGTGFLDCLSCGASVSLAGVCLTVVRVDAMSFTMEVSAETQACTTLSSLCDGQRVNLESSLKLGGTFDGHFVSGHVDATARVLERTPDAGSECFKIEAPGPLAKFIAPKGSICLDGVSLTINEVSEADFCVNIIPHTLENTTFCLKRPGDRVNLEVDLIARYVASLLSARPYLDAGFQS